MRSPQNNPIERIGRLLQEADEVAAALQAWAEALRKVQEMVAYGMAPSKEYMDNLVAGLPPLPKTPAIASEKTRRSLTYMRATKADRQRKELHSLLADEIPVERPPTFKEITKALEAADAKAAQEEASADALSIVSPKQLLGDL